MAHQAGAYPGFCSMKRLGVFLLPPGWDASPSQKVSKYCTIDLSHIIREAAWCFRLVPFQRARITDRVIFARKLSYHINSI